MRDKSSTWAVILPALLSFLGILALILDAQTAVAAAGEGIRLCLETVVPALFPFLVLSRLFTGSAAVQGCTKILGPIMRPLFGLPAQGAAAVAMGALGGYPVGAQTAADLYRDGRLDRESAERLLGFCSNAGPAFIFGMLGGIFGSPKTAAALYCIHITSALLTGVLLRTKDTGPAAQRLSDGRGPSISLPEAVSAAIKTMALICGYVILFRVISVFLGKALGTWLSPAMNVAVSGLLELAGGCCLLPQLGAPGLRYCMASGFLAFGGVCVWMQTKSVIRPAGLTGKYYLFGKILQGTLAVLITWFVMVAFPGILPREVSVSEVVIPNHAGLLRATGTVTGLFLVCVGIWCLNLRKRAGKQKTAEV